jgi:hypothetical protein
MQELLGVRRGFAPDDDGRLGQGPNATDCAKSVGFSPGE